MIYLICQVHSSRAHGQRRPRRVPRGGPAREGARQRPEREQPPPGEFPRSCHRRLQRAHVRDHFFKYREIVISVFLLLTQGERVRGQQQPILLRQGPRQQFAQRPEHGDERGLLEEHTHWRRRHQSRYQQLALNFSDSFFLN